MEKAALIEIGPSSLKLITISLIGGGYHKKVNTIKEIIRYDEDIFEQQSIGLPKFTETIKYLKLFKEICEADNIVKIYCYASSVFSSLRNSKSFFEDLTNNTGFTFYVLSEEEELKFAYNAILNSVEPNKALLFYVNPHNTLLINFAKRNILSSNCFPVGANFLSYQFKDSSKSAQEIVDNITQIAKDQLKTVTLDYNPEEIGFIGAGEFFVVLSKLVRKITRYPLDQDNNMVITKPIFDKAINLLIEQGFDRTKKMSAISDERLDNLISGFAIIKAFFEEFNVEKIYISIKEISDAIISAKIIKETASETNSADVLENSLETIRYYFNIEDSNADWVYNLTINLFKQMSIIHKLTRKHVKALKIASFLYDCGKRIELENHSKFSKDIILNQRILGANHKDIIIAAFACQCQNQENFQLSEWIKYKDIVNEEDLIAVRKIGMLIKLAESLDCNKQRKVYEVNCDLLGDIVIIKIRTNGNAIYEMQEANKLVGQFKKIFKKNFQII